MISMLKLGMEYTKRVLIDQKSFIQLESNRIQTFWNSVLYVGPLNMPSEVINEVTESLSLSSPT